MKRSLLLPASLRLMPWLSLLWSFLPVMPVRADVPAAESYALHCGGCHRPDGAGSAPSVPTLHGLAELLEMPAARAYLGRVPGVAQAPIESPELAALLNWVLREFSEEADFEPFTGAELERLRRDPLRDPVRARAALMAAPHPGRARSPASSVSSSAARP